MQSHIPSCVLRLALFLAAVLATPPIHAAEDPEAKPGKRPVVISPNETEVSLFGIAAKGTKFVYVLDRSGSMGGSGGKALEAAKKELLASIEKLDRVQQFQIVVYNERPRIFNPAGQPGKLAFGTRENKDEVRKFMASLKADGATSHEDAIKLAIRLHPDVIFLLTDADRPKLSPRQLDSIDRLGPGITIHTIEFGTGPQPEAENFLVKLAQQSAGKHVYVDVSKLEARQGEVKQAARLLRPPASEGRE